MRNFQRTGFCAGSYDPVTVGHVDVMASAAKIFDKLVVGVGFNPKKKTLFTPEERVELVQHDVDEILKPQLTAADIDCDIEVVAFSCLTVEFMKQRGISVNVRGMRGVRDFSAEEELGMVNADLFHEGKPPDGLTGKFTQVLIYTTDPQLIKVSSSVARELCANRADDALLRYVSPYVREQLIRRMEREGLRRDL